MVTIRRVLVVSKTHLDVGFTDTAAAVRRRYLDEFFPRAMAVAEQLRAEGGPARLRWTTGSWILSEALEEADTAGRRRLERAIDEGDLCWHALPFTLHTEYTERSLVAHGLSLSAELDRRFGRRTCAAKVTDVPGHTRGLVPLLADAGVELLHVGVNPASSAPQVPDRFRWRVGSAELMVMYQPGGYGDLQVLEDGGGDDDVAVVVDLTGDNLGPRGATEVTEAFARLAERFPGAEVVAATLDDVAEAMRRVRTELPVVEAEIGDSWVHGTGSDPRKTAAFRALCAQRRRWFDDGRADAQEPAVSAASTQLLQVAEHTWGLDQKTHWPETGHWSATQLSGIRGRPDTAAFEASWAEQRHLLDRYVDTLRAHGRADLADDATALRRSLVPVRPDPAAAGWSRVVASDTPLALGDWSVVVDTTDGSLRSLLDGRGREHVGAGGLGAVTIRTHDADDFERWFRTYNADTTAEDEWWARWDNTKPGLEHSGARSDQWHVVLHEVFRGEDDSGPVLALRLGTSAGPDDPVAAPAELWQLVRPAPDGGAVAFELSWFDLGAARWPMTVWWGFDPQVDDPAAWWLWKLGERISPFDVVADGGRRLHVVDRVEHADGTRLVPVDSGLVAPGDTDLLRWHDRQVDLSSGWQLCLFANLWGTNFPMWTEGDARFRVELRLPGLPPPEDPGT